MKKITAITTVILLTIATATMAQQTDSRWGFELSGGPAFATHDLADANLKTGAGFEAIFHYRALPHAGVYAGWGWKKFAAGHSFAGNNMDFEETGYVFGLQFKHPVGNSPISWYARGGGLYNHIEIENSDGDIIEDTGHGLGWQLAGGVDIPLGRYWNLTPGFKFNSLSRTLETTEYRQSLDLDYLSFRVGFLRSF